ncbi:MAG: hypothetical protein NC543_06745 [bacterium]|nr:hypothetical protein [bacterium]
MNLWGGWRSYVYTLTWRGAGEACGPDGEAMSMDWSGGGRENLCGLDDEAMSVEAERQMRQDIF